MRVGAAFCRPRATESRPYFFLQPVGITGVLGFVLKTEN